MIPGIPLSLSSLSGSVDTRNTVRGGRRRWFGEKLVFHSLMVDLGVLCGGRYMQTLFGSVVMGGGIVGAFTWGYAADRSASPSLRRRLHSRTSARGCRWGRKWSMMLPLSGVAVLNALIAAVGGLHLASTLALLAIMGFFGGGFMVTNIVFAIEAFGGQTWRLAVVSVNGWPAGPLNIRLATGSQPNGSGHRDAVDGAGGVADAALALLPHRPLHHRPPLHRLDDLLHLRIPSLARSATAPPGGPRRSPFLPPVPVSFLHPSRSLSRSWATSAASTGSRPPSP